MHRGRRILKQQLAEHHHHFVSDTDTEVIAQLLGRNLAELIGDHNGQREGAEELPVRLFIDAQGQVADAIRQLLSDEGIEVLLSA